LAIDGLAIDDSNRRFHLDDRQSTIQSTFVDPSIGNRQSPIR
jgi:hypothetical protein